MKQATKSLLIVIQDRSGALEAAAKTQTVEVFFRPGSGEGRWSATVIYDSYAITDAVVAFLRFK